MRPSEAGSQFNTLEEAASIAEVKLKRAVQLSVVAIAFGAISLALAVLLVFT